MSGQPSQRVRRMASPSTKQGPMKAMKAFTLIQGSPISSPTSNLSSEPHRIKTHRRSPDSRSSPERRSPSSPSFKVERPKAARVSPASSSGLRRTGSLDTLRPIPLDTVGPYLTGQWPKDKTSVTSYHHYQAAGLLSCDKSTQTPDEWEISNNAEGKQKGHKRSSSLGNGDLKDFRQRLQRGSKQSELTKPRQSPVPGNHQALSATLPPFNGQSKAILIPTHISKATPSRPHPRNSVEGLNPEIENLTISSGEEPDEKISDNVFQQDGRRAPGPEMCRGSSTRSIDTQTPASSYVDEAATSSSGSRSHSVSPALPIIPGPMDTSRPSSIGDSLDNTARDAKRDDKGMENEVSPESPDVTAATKAASPMPNKSCSFVREPPDGCEKVKAIDEKERPRIKEPLFRPVKPNEFVLRPSVGSAFRPALKDTYSIMGLQPHSAHIAIKSPGVQTSSPQTSIESQ